MSNPNRSGYTPPIPKRESDLPPHQQISHSHPHTPQQQHHQQQQQQHHPMSMQSMPHSIPQSQNSLPPVSSHVLDSAPLHSALLSQSYPYAPYGPYSGRLPNTSSSSGTPSPHATTLPSAVTPPPVSTTSFISPAQAMHTMPAASTASPPHSAYAYAPYVPPPAHDPGIYSQPQWAGAVDGQHAALYATPHQNSFAQPPQNRGSANVYSFVPIQGPQQHKRPRRRYEEIERIYKCGSNGCEKAYGTLNHLNAHVTMQTHGPKRTSDEFKEIRAAWKQRNKENEARKREELAVQAQSAASAASHTPLYFAHPQHAPYQHSPVGYSVVSPLNSNPGSFPVSPYGAPQNGGPQYGGPQNGSQPQPSQSARPQPTYSNREDM